MRGTKEGPGSIFGANIFWMPEVVSPPWPKLVGQKKCLVCRNIFRRTPKPLHLFAGHTERSFPPIYVQMKSFFFQEGIEVLTSAPQKIQITLALIPVVSTGVKNTTWAALACCQTLRLEA